MPVQLSISQKGPDFWTGINHIHSKNFIDLDEGIERYASFCLYRMLGLDQNSFYIASKYFSIGNGYNGIAMKFALENIFIAEYLCTNA